MPLKRIFEQQQSYLNHFYQHLDQERAGAFFDACLQSQGLLVLTGVGKSGIIAEKIAMTLTSTGTKAIFLPPTNFLHGDIGIVSESDTVIFLSKSGETEELLSLIPFVRKRKAKTLAIVSNPQSRLGKICDQSIYLPVEKELCPFDLAPTTSTAVQLLFGDVLAMALMRAKSFSVDGFAQNHPSGTLGKKMTLTVEELMLKGQEIPISSSEARLVDQLVELSNKKCGCLLITDETQQLLGIFTDGDLRRALQNQGPGVLEMPLKQLMTHSPLSVEPQMLAWDALKVMQKTPQRWIMVLPVVQANKIIGILRLHDIIQAGLS